jgi:polygalacturonase
MKRRPALIQLFSVGIFLSQIAKSAHAVQRIYPQDFHKGGEDWTEAFQAAINSAEYKQVYIKRGIYFIKPVYFISNVDIFLEPGVVIKRHGSYPGGNDCMFNLNGITDVKISGKGAILDMNAQTYLGEWRHNVVIQGSRNITIQGLKCIRAGGDGFYIGRGLKNQITYCQNITLDRVVAESNRRQGLSIISVKGCKIRNSRFLKTSGTAPAAGVDIEPDKLDESLEDISIVNCTFEDNVRNSSIKG